MRKRLASYLVMLGTEPTPSRSLNKLIATTLMPPAKGKKRIKLVKRNTKAPKSEDSLPAGDYLPPGEPMDIDVPPPKPDLTEHYHGGHNSQLSSPPGLSPSNSTSEEEEYDEEAAIRAAHNKCLSEYDAMFAALDRLCLTPGKWVRCIGTTPPTPPPPPHGLPLSPPGLKLWRDLATELFLPHTLGEAAEDERTGRHWVGVRIMSLVWEDIMAYVFGAEFGRRGEGFPKTLEDHGGCDAKMQLASYLLGKYRIFERYPYDVLIRREHESQVRELARAAIELRKGMRCHDPSATYEIYRPSTKAHDDVRFRLLQNTNRSLLTLNHEALHKEKEPGPTEDIIILTLCGGLLRRPTPLYHVKESGKWRLGKMMPRVCERKAVVVTWSAPVSRNFKKLCNLMKTKTEEAIVNDSREVAERLALEVSGIMSDEGYTDDSEDWDDL